VVSGDQWNGTRWSRLWQRDDRLRCGDSEGDEIMRERMKQKKVKKVCESGRSGRSGREWGVRGR
jgi:hypothetical protein